MVERRTLVGFKLAGGVVINSHKRANVCGVKIKQAVLIIRHFFLDDTPTF